MSNNEKIMLYGTITLSINKVFSKDDFMGYYAEGCDKNVAEKVWTALIKKARWGEIDLGHLEDAEEEDDLDVEFQNLVEEEIEKVQSSSSEPQQVSSSSVLSSAAASS